MEQELRALRGVATAKARPYLKSMVESEMETDESKQMARDILAHLDKNK